jgi:acetyltransferase-like isoleucine patch superfamily enzyme
MMFGPENIALGERVILNEGVVLQSCDGAAIELGAHVVVSFGGMILTGGIDLTKDSVRSHVSRPIKVGDYSWIGARAIILPGVSIGPRAVIGAGSVVTRDVPENGRVGGVPARALGVKSVR